MNNSSFEDVLYGIERDQYTPIGDLELPHKSVRQNEIKDDKDQYDETIVEDLE